MAIRKWAPWVVAPALLAMVAALLISIAGVGGSAPPVDGEADGALRRDAASYAADFGVSETEALRRLRLQDEIGSLDEKVAEGDSSTFGGLWIQHTPDYKVKVAFTENGSSKLSEYETSSDLSGDLEVVSVSASMETLLSAQNSAMGAAQRVSQATESDIIVSDNQVELYTLDSESLKRALSSAGETLPANVVVKQVAAFSSVDHGSEIHGGEEMVECTTGFSVEHSDGTQGISTAGHCARDQQVSGVSLHFEREADGGSYDVQWHTVDDEDGDDDHEFRNLVYDGTHHRLITSEKGRSQQSVGEYVCKYGRATRETCGNIASKNYLPDAPYGGNVWIRVHKEGVDLSKSGDSGAPWYRGNAAYGIHHGGAGADDKDAVYMAINYIDYLDLSVITDSD